MTTTAITVTSSTILNKFTPVTFIIILRNWNIIHSQGMTYCS
jgi:hypothetical protein